MKTEGEEFEGVLRSALERPTGVALGVAIPVPAFTVLIACGDSDDEVRVAAAAMLREFTRDGRPPGRIIVLLPPGGDGESDRRRATELRAELGIPVIAHDPERSPCYVAGHGPARVALEFDDELREAEAVVLVAGPCRDSDGRWRPPLSALVPGMLSGGTRRALEAAGLDRRGAWDELRREMAEMVPVDYALLWWRSADGAWRARSGSDVGTLLDPSAHRG